MRHMLIALVIGFMALVQPVFAGGSPGHGTGSPAAYVQEHGREAAAQAFMSPDGECTTALSVFAMDDQGIMWAHGVNLALVGQDLSDLVDVTGSFFIREFIAIETEGWVDYLWENPVTGESELKSSYIVRVSEGNIVGVGAYKELRGYS